MLVKVYKGNLNKAMAILNKRMREDGDFKRSIERSRYEKPSDKRRRVKKENARNAFKEKIKVAREVEGLAFNGKGISLK